MSYYDEALMRSRIDACLQKVRMVADKDHASQIHAADQVPHQYADKFLLADTLTNTMCVSLVHCLSLIGLSRENLKPLKSWGAEKTVTLSFRVTRKTTLLREHEREVESPTRVQETSEASGTSTITVVKKVKEYVFLEEQAHQLVAFTGVGDNAEEFLTAVDRSGSTERTSTFRSDNSDYTRNHDLDLSWLLSVLSEEVNVTLFVIDRSHVDCFTPVQNRAINEAKMFARRLSDFAHSLSYDVRQRRAIQVNEKSAAYTSTADHSPVVPLFEASNELGAAPMSSEMINALNTEYQKHLVRICAEMEAAAQPSNDDPVLYGPNEAKLAEIMNSIIALTNSYHSSTAFLEDMIRKQLVAAIGKTVSAQDFAQYMTFHNRKVFKEAYQPQPFSYAVRRSPVHSPEGQIQIETSSNGTPAEPIYTVSQHVEHAPHMEFALNATTTVKFGGERHLHGWMAHQFSGQAKPQLKLVAEARQFSSYIVLIGRIASATLFQPKYGFIVQNKDEFRIPLDLEQIPTAKEFKDAISSLSPEQQRFAKAFRSMQLESTLFGVCVIQIKPQLEKVLKLQADSLTKEIKLTQDLMQLFIKYQIPTDLLSYQGQDQEGGGGAELTAVKGHAQALQEVLLSAKEEEVAEAELQRSHMTGRDAKNSTEDIDEQVEKTGKNKGYFASYCSFGGGIFTGKQITRTLVSLSTKITQHSQPPLPRADKIAAGEPSDQAHLQDPSGALDFTAYPAKLEEMYTQYDPDSSLRPTIINPGATWTKRSQKGLLSAPQTTSVTADLHATEKTAAFDLLDALTRSGALPIEHASLHVIIAATHCFDQSVMDTVVQKNVNPIERVERSTLIMAAALNDVPASALIKSSQVDRVCEFSPMLFPPPLLPTVAAAEESGLLKNED